MTADDLKRYENALIYGTSHPEAYMTKVDELWYQFSGAEGLDGSTRMVKADFLAALAERDAYVKKECVRVCIEETKSGLPPMWISVAQKCAAAIEKLEIK